ncbi:competence protein ComG [Pullulanibacillus camelliae]|uniref:Competence protein ComG n=1 Tax=Pullulanibacillus camelliae TaxID=1707096 RepID=A0A8J2YJB3_9BACL|nr:competence type IV pilus assembly protein ComGB [Pullulanibacillus camelliae]GGE46740.1 competence protein ComG [Pullulanibacillus camelliae]
MFIHKWKLKDQASFLTEVGKCLERGYSLAAAINLQSYQQKAFIQDCIDKLLNELSQGKAISEVFAQNNFSKDVCSFLYFAEKKGDLPSGFMEAGHLLHFREKQKQTLDRVLRYPFVLLWVFGVMVYVMVNHLLPSFEQIYTSLSIKTPFLIKVLLALSGHFFPLSLFLILVCLLICFLIFALQKRLSLRQKLSLLLRLPITSKPTKVYLTYLFSFHFGGLLQLGMSVNQALDLMAEQVYQPFIQSEARQVSFELHQGIALTDSIANRSYYLQELAVVIHNGQSYGRLGAMLFDYSGLVLRRMDLGIKKCFAMIQPVFFVLFAGLIILLFLSIMLPIFHMIDGI